ncbi:uridine kinase [Arcanobacterium hippocoleae]
MAQSLVIGIAGGTGSGKSTLTNAIKSRFSGSVAVMYHDNYYCVQDHLTFEQRTQINYDAPEAFDNQLLISQLKQLIDGAAIESPVYDFAVHNRSAEKMQVEPAPVIIVEGILIFAEPELRSLFDLKLFVDTDADVRILRRMQRDVAERGRSIESVRAQYLRTVKPMHELYVEPSKRFADVIIPEGGQNLVAVEMIFHRIQNQLDNRCFR